MKCVTVGFLVLYGTTGGIKIQAQQQTAMRDVPASIVPRDALLAKPVSLNLTKVSLRQAVSAVAASAGIQLSYRYGVLDAWPTPIDVHVSQVRAADVFVQILAGTQLHLVPLSGASFSLEPMGPRQSVGAIVGHVRDTKTSKPLFGATVFLDGATKGISTDADGVYRFPSVMTGSHNVLVKAIGYVRQTKTVVVTDNGMATLDIALEASVNQLDQVVVTGTIIPTELKAVSNAITVITAKQIEQRGITRIDQLFRGDVPGLFALNQGSGATLDEVTMFARGVTALSGNSAGISTVTGNTNPIKTYIDGVEMADPQYLSQIDPKSIERIEILTGPQASTIDGSNAINGVMQIFTKRGTTSKPQLSLNLLSGWVENNFSSAHTPQHDYNAQLNGLEGKLSYNAGSSWNYMGPWTPAKQVARTEAFGGARLELPPHAGHVTADMTLRRSNTTNRQAGTTQQQNTGYRETGWWRVAANAGVSAPTAYTLTGQTLGLAVGYAPFNWWSHEVGLGQDIEDTEQRITARGYNFGPSDSTLSLYQTHTGKRSQRYTTTVRVPIVGSAQATVTVGGDAWQSLSSILSISPQTLSGTLTSPSYFITRQPSHNTGGFLQAQFGIRDQIFLTYGLRAEWNPGFGAEAQPNYAPRFGVAYTQDVGPVTAKFRASYGRSTRPPIAGYKNAQTVAQWYGTTSTILTDYGNYDYVVANPALGPEHQQGGEGGFELYLGSRGSLVVTRYNQIVEDLIDFARIDSVRSLSTAPVSGSQTFVPDPAGYGYWGKWQYANIGAVRNQGWELQTSGTTGPFTTRATYSWTKSRTIGVDARYRAAFTGAQYKPGGTFSYLPEHTWAVGTTYARAQTTIMITVMGVGQLRNFQNDFYFRNLISTIRLPQNRFSVTSQYVNINQGYASADLTATHRFSSKVEAVAQVQNLTDRYTNDYWASYVSIGRQVKAGLRLRLQ